MEESLGVITDAALLVVIDQGLFSSCDECTLQTDLTPFTYHPASGPLHQIVEGEVGNRSLEKDRSWLRTIYLKLDKPSCALSGTIQAEKS